MIKEKYKLSCCYIIDSNDYLRLDEDSYWYEYVVKYEKNICGVDINNKKISFVINKNEDKKIKFDVNLEFEDIYDEQVFINMCNINKIYPPNKESAGSLIIRDNEFGTKTLPLRIVFYEILSHIFRYLAIHGRAARFYEDFIECKYPYFVTIEVGNRNIVIGTLHINTANINIRRLLLDKNKIEKINNFEANSYISFLLWSDIQLNNGDFRGAITNLSTAMEVAAYKFGNKIGQNKYNFNPERYFQGINKNGYLPKVREYININGELDSNIFFHLNSLWKTRHRIVHDGQLIYDSGNGNRREITYDDYYDFRSALSSVLIWMGFDSIE